MHGHPEDRAPRARRRPGRRPASRPGPCCRARRRRPTHCRGGSHTPRIAAPCAERDCSSRPAAASQKRTELSAEPLAILVPSLERKTAWTGPAWPAAVATFLPSATVQTLIGLVRRARHELRPVAAQVQGEHGLGVAGEVADRLAHGDVPELRRLVGGGRDEEVRIVGGEGQGMNPRGVAGHRLEDRAVGGVDDLDLVVLARRGDLRPVGAEGQGGDGGGECRGLLDLGAVGDVADPDDLAGQGEGDLGAVPVERQCGDRRVGAGDLLDQGPVGRVPDAHDHVGAAGGELRAVGAHGEGGHGPLGVDQARLGDGELPEPGQAVGAGRDELLVVGEVGQAEHGVGGGLDDPLRGPVGRVPEADGLRLVARGDLRGVAAPGDRLDVTGVAGEVLDGGPGGQVPDP